MNYHTALDVSLRSVSICTVDDGTIQFEAKVPSEVDEIVACLRRFDPKVCSVGSLVYFGVSGEVFIIFRVVNH
jgi:hypothetical protein